MKKFALLSILALALIGTGINAQTPDAVQYKYANVDGSRVFYREAGDPKLQTIVLLHGFPTSSFMYRDLIPKLSQRFHVIAPDDPGMGYSDVPPSFDRTFSNEAAWITKFLEQTGQRRFIFYLQDMGGPVGMRIATSHPDWVAGLIFQNTIISFDGWNPKFLKEFQEPNSEEKKAAMAKILTIDTDIFFHKQGAHSPDTLSPDNWAIDAFPLSSQEKRDVALALLLDIPSNIDLYQDWQNYLKTKQPHTLVVWGDGDPLFTPQGGDAIKALVPGAEVHHYAASHFLLDEQSSDVADRIISAFAKGSH